MNNPFADLSLEQLQDLKNKAIWHSHLVKGSKFLKQGVALGAGGSAISLLLKNMSKRTSPPKSSYTMPVSANVYTPEPEEVDTTATRRKRKTAGVSFRWPDFSEIPKEFLDASNKDKFNIAVGASAIGAGIPLGLWGTRRLGNVVSELARNRDLYYAQREYEKAISDYVTRNSSDNKDKKRKTQKRGSIESQKIDRLAENMVKIASNPSMGNKLLQFIIAYSLLTPLIGASVGFKSKWEDRDYKKLENAERKLQLERELRNPTFTIANLQTIPRIKQEQEQELLEDKDKQKSPARTPLLTHSLDTSYI